MAKQEKSKSKLNYEQRIVKPRAMAEGEELEGKLLAIQQGGNTKVLLILCEGGVLERIWSSTVLDNALMPADIGKRIHLKYIGKTVSKSTGRPVKEYEVGVERA